MNIQSTSCLAALALLVLGAPAVAQLTIATDADHYTVGDVVTITIHNAGPEPELLISFPYVAIIHVDSGDCLFGCSGIPVVTEMAVGETIVTTWDTGELPDPVGTYRLVLAAQSDHPDSILETGYELLGPVGTSWATWDHVRALYR